jgi:hypothetical protein
MREKDGSLKDRYGKIKKAYCDTNLTRLKEN